MTATWYHQATEATTYLRCELPARHLPGKMLEAAKYVQTDDDYWFEGHEGAAVFQFPGSKYEAVMLLGMQHKGIRVLAEMDDNYLARAPNFAKGAWGVRIGDNHFTHEGHKAFIRDCDGVIVTNEQLARRYRKAGKEAFVCPNQIDPQDWPDPPVKPDDGVLRIGWFASGSHAADAPLIRRAFEWAQQQPNVEVVVLGYRPSWFRGRDIGGWLELPEYRQMMGLLDVGVAPVLETHWSVCRSDVKALEYAMGGAVPVVQDLDPYGELTHGENCLKAKTATDFYHRIKDLVRDPDGTREFAQRCRDYVLRHRTVAGNIDRWRTAVEG